MHPGLTVAVQVRDRINDRGEVAEPGREETVSVQGEADRIGYRRQGKWVVLDFARRERQSFDPEARTVAREPLHALAASRSLERANRERIGEVMAAGGVADNDFQRVLVEHQLAVMASDSKTRLGGRSFLGRLMGSPPGSSRSSETGRRTSSPTRGRCCRWPRPPSRRRRHLSSISSAPSSVGTPSCSGASAPAAACRAR